ncbi:NAD(P)/FAD-dependent oxidoreductase [Lacticigenium naphthae]|uniref:NAD(P)/FAD-dependent oxidoreductase n=1 Tax=Lacticigenium naphthae TaxID=515351 RepID=UPI0004074F7B|nr:FAD-binding oxidoreductase [Lacticigenium naphthae]
MPDKKRVAVIGSGIIGATTAYYLSKEKNIELIIYDEGIGQATSAAAGIINPWLSKRRNKKWYSLVREGAAFYPTLMTELGETSSFYKKTGALLFKKKEKALSELKEIGEKRRKQAPEIGELRILQAEAIKEMIPIYDKSQPALYVSGAARVDGKALVQKLIKIAQKNGAQFVPKKAFIQRAEKDKYIVTATSSQETFDVIVLATGAWLGQTLDPLGYSTDIRPQKGQLAQLQIPFLQTAEWPVIIPEGEKDIIPFEEGMLYIGATHENEQGFDLLIDSTKLKSMIRESQEEFSSQLDEDQVIQHKVGTRAYTSDFSPFFGEIPLAPNLFAASGMGSTGLTAGPLVGFILAQLVTGKESLLPLEDYPIENYVKRKNE